MHFMVSFTPYQNISPYLFVLPRSYDTWFRVIMVVSCPLCLWECEQSPQACVILLGCYFCNWWLLGGPLTRQSRQCSWASCTWRDDMVLLTSCLSPSSVVPVASICQPWSCCTRLFLCHGSWCYHCHHHESRHSIFHGIANSPPSQKIL